MDSHPPYSECYAKSHSRSGNGYPPEKHYSDSDRRCKLKSAVGLSGHRYKEGVFTFTQKGLLISWQGVVFKCIYLGESECDKARWKRKTVATTRNKVKLPFHSLV